MPETPFGPSGKDGFKPHANGPHIVPPHNPDIPQHPSPQSAEQPAAPVQPLASNTSHRQPPTVEHTIQEREAWHLPTWASFLLVFALVAVLGIAIWLLTVSVETDSSVAFPVILLVLALLPASGFHIVQPGHTKVLVFFGKYVGTIRDTGFIFANPFAKGTKMSVRVRNFETNELKINDLDGNPVTTAAIVVWTVADTARASFAVENYEEFIYAQSESALRHVISGHPYDEGNRQDVVSLRGSTDEVSQELADEVSARVAAAGIQVIEARISSLAYAPEIAQAMLQRQQAAAVVAARERIVEGAVSMVEDALDRLEAQDIVELDDERRASMVSNLLVVLCSDNHVSPVVNTGSLYN